MSCKKIARHLRVSESTVYRRLCELELAPKRRKLSEVQRLQIEALIREGRLNYSEIARKFTVNRLSVLRMARQLAERDAALESDDDWSGDNPLQEHDFRPVSFRRAVSCEHCGRLITVLPCVACTAKAVSAEKSNKQ